MHRNRIALGPAVTSVSKGTAALLYLAALVGTLACIPALHRSFGQRTGLALYLLILAVAVIGVPPAAALIHYAFGTVVELDQMELRVYPNGRFRRPECFPRHGVAHVSLWRLDDDKPQHSRRLHIQLVDGSDKLFSQSYGGDRASDVAQLKALLGPLFRA